MKFYFTFHNIGQGLFYSGKIGNFNFIYDCGSENINWLKKVIDDYISFLAYDKLDMIVISHFHYDHINGLDYLLVNLKDKPQYIFLPYFTDIERVYILEKNIKYAVQNNWYVDFLKNPSSYLKEKEIKNIYYIHPSNHEENEDFSVSNNNFEELQIRLDSIGENINGLVGKHCTDKGYVQIGYWLFKFFNLKKNLDKLDKFENCLKEKNIDIKKLDINRDKDKLKKCYNKFSGNFNDTSLVMLHKPLTKMKLYKMCFYSFYRFCEHKNYWCKEERDYYCYRLYKKYKYFCDYICDYKSFAQLLTGDINLKNKNNYNEFKKHFNKMLKDVCVFQIPHHGAKGNWNENLLGDLNNCFYWIANSGIKNKYNHPSFKIFMDIISNNKCFINVNESSSSRFTIILKG